MDEWTWSACHVELSREFMSHSLFFNQVDIASHSVQNGFELIICRYEERREEWEKERVRCVFTIPSDNKMFHSSKNNTRRRLNYMVSRRAHSTHTQCTCLVQPHIFFVRPSLSVSCANNGFVCVCAVWARTRTQPHNA